MKTFRNAASTMVVTASLLAATAALAGPVTLGISAASITPGSGYGVDGGANGENGGTLLDVRFSSALFSSQSLSFAALGDTRSFTLGTVYFGEPDTGNGANRGIRNQEQDGLGVSVAFTFTDLLGTISNLTGTGTATLGPITDSPEAVDFTLAWNPLEVDFGAGGKFSISLNPLSFSNIGTQTETATVKLLSAPPSPPQVREPASAAPSGGQAVPEPGTLALVGVAFAGACMARRRRSAPRATLR